MAVWCKFVSATANEKSSSCGSSQDVEAVAVVPAPAKNSSQTQAAATKEVKTRPTPKQDELKEKMGIEKDILLGLYRKREHGMLSVQDSDELKKRVSKKAKLENELKAVETNRLRQIIFRDDRKKKMLSLDGNTRKMITGKTEITPGAPMKIDNPELIDAIARIAMTGSAAHERRRSEVIRTVKILDQLTAALRSEGFDLQRYLRLIPRNVRTIEGKKHVRTAPVKLLRSQNSKHNSHIGAMFARSAFGGERGISWS